EIDPVGLEPLQARLDRGHDVAARAAFEPPFAVHRPAELGHQHDILAPAPQHLAQDGLGAATPAVDVAAIEEGDAEVERLVNHRARGFEVEWPAEIVAAETDRRHPQT